MKINNFSDNFSKLSGRQKLVKLVLFARSRFDQLSSFTMKSALSLLAAALGTACFNASAQKTQALSLRAANKESVFSCRLKGPGRKMVSLCASASSAPQEERGFYHLHGRPLRIERRYPSGDKSGRAFMFTRISRIGDILGYAYALPRLVATASFIFFTLTFPACGQSMKTPDIKLSPHPKMRYEVTLTIEDAPGPFDAVEGSAGYEVANGRCVPPTPSSGATLTPEKNVPMTLTRVSDKVYQGELYVDLLADEDYFGRGLCRWTMPFANFSLQVGGLVFSHFIALNDILAGKSTTRYFSKLSYRENATLKQDERPWVNSGNAQRSDFKQPESTFSMTLIAKERVQ